MRHDKIFTRMRRGSNMLLRLVLSAALLTAFLKTANAPGVVQDDSQLQCIVSAVYHEARGEPDAGKRAVVETIFNRVRKSGTTVCEVVAQRKQFPWFQKKGLVELTPENSVYYNSAMLHPAVLNSEKYIFFNGVKPHGVGCRRIGGHTFCKEKT